MTSQQEPFSIDVGDIIRHKQYSGEEYEVVKKWQPTAGADWHYLLRKTDGSLILDPYTAMEKGSRTGKPASVERASEAVYVSCEKWAMKKVQP